MNWSSSVGLALVGTIAVGAVVALQPPLNSELGRRTSILAAAFISAAVTFLVIGLMFLLLGDIQSLKNVTSVPPTYLAGGLCGAAFVAVSLVTVRYLGAGTLVVATVSAQVVVAALLDRFGVLGLERVPLTPSRILGVAAMLTGVVLVTLR